MPKRRRYFSYYPYFEPTRPIETQEGIKARSQRGAFAKNWWAERWIEALERLMDPGRLTRGRSYARKGQVLSIGPALNPAVGMCRCWPHCGQTKLCTIPAPILRYLLSR